MTIHRMNGLELRAEPSTLVDVFTRCDAIDAWAAECDSVAELKQSANELAALDEYLARTLTEGRGRVAATERRIDTRIGELLPEPNIGRPEKGKRDSSFSIIERHAAREMREMAAHPEVVEQVIAESDDVHPASRRKVIDAIRAATDPVADLDEPEQERTTITGIDGKTYQAARPRSTAANNRPREDKAAEISSLAEEGLTSRQIAPRLGISAHRVRDIAREYAVEIPADVVVGRSRLIDSNRVVQETVIAAEGAAFGLTLIDFADLDRSQIPGWVDSLTTSIRSLNQILKAMKELTRD